MMKQLWICLFSLFIFLSAHNALAAACCGSGFATPSLISGDDKAQLTTSYSHTEVAIDNVDAKGVWRKWDEHQKVQTFKIEAAHIFADVWQAGFSLPVIQRSHIGQRYSGLGDAAATLGYEYLPDWNYHPYRPKGIGFLQLTLPTGKAKADSNVGGLDSRGNGFWAIGAGTLLTKIWSRWDAYTSLEIHRSFNREIENSSLNTSLKPGFGGNYALGLGYNVKDYRFGSSITWTYEDPIEVLNKSSAQKTSGSVERYATALFNISYMASDLWSGTLTYSDQTLFGSPVNTSLGRGLSLQLQRRWQR